MKFQVEKIACGILYQLSSPPDFVLIFVPRKLVEAKMRRAELWHKTVLPVLHRPLCSMLKYGLL